MSLDAQTLRRRVLPALLLVGAASLVGYFLRDAPREHEIELGIEGPRERLTRAELRLVGPDGEEEAGARWSWAPGRAPPLVRSSLRVAPGRWRVLVRLETPQNTALIERSVLLQGESVRIPVRVE